MSSSDQRTQLKLVTVGDLDPQSDRAIEYDFIGRVIAGRYTVRKHIGGGGMADVFLATDEELAIDVAIKLLKPRMASDELRARMVQEAKAAAQVRHANLVRVFGTGKLDATAYIAMELLAGPNLEQYVREYRSQRVPWKEALELLLPALEALHAIHEQGYIHRDIKPGNILVTREAGCPPQAIVIDLGLVKPDRALRNAASPPTTEVGRMLCTPTGLAYVRPDGVRVADWDDLILNGPGDGVTVTDTGEMLLGKYAWTGTAPSGKLFDPSATCKAWSSSAAADKSRVGISGVDKQQLPVWIQWVADKQWTSYTSFGCYIKCRLFCIEQ